MTTYGRHQETYIKYTIPCTLYMLYIHLVSRYKKAQFAKNSGSLLSLKKMFSTYSILDHAGTQYNQA